MEEVVQTSLKMDRQACKENHVPGEYECFSVEMKIRRNWQILGFTNFLIHAKC